MNVVPTLIAVGATAVRLLPGTKAAYHAAAVLAAGGFVALLDAIADHPMLARYHLLSAARGDLLEKLGRHAEARVEFERAAALRDKARALEQLELQMR